MPDILDSMIAIAIILFILSVIVEKITQLIRRYSPIIKPAPVKNKITLRTTWRNINNKQGSGSTEMDKIIEREVTSLSFVIGSLLAISFHVDLFQMIKADDPRKILFWADAVTFDSIADFLLFVLSILLTGFFLSFGSKFFHDLIETLMEIKNLKRKLADDETFKSDTIENFDSYLTTSYSSIFKAVIEQNKAVLQSPNATSPPMAGKMKKDGHLVECITIHVNSKDRGTIPLSVQATLNGGRIVTMPVYVIFDVDIPTTHASQGDSAANAKTSDYLGTICCQVKKFDGTFLLTCSHVVTGGTPVNHFGPINLSPAKIDGQSDGNFTWALCTDHYDIALLAPGSSPFKYAIPPKKERKPAPSDILSTRVRIVCRDNEIKRGIVINDCCEDPIAIQYENGDLHSIINLILLSNADMSGDEIVYKGITEAGDSGALVVDSNDQPIGMVVAGNSKFSYAISIKDILHRLKATII